MFNTNLNHSLELTVTVRNRSKVVYQGPAKAISSINVRGKFDILPQHANFISIIKDYVIIHKPDGTQQAVKLTRGVIKVDGNIVSIYLGVTRQTTPNP